MVIEELYLDLLKKELMGIGGKEYKPARGRLMTLLKPLLKLSRTPFLDIAQLIPDMDDLKIQGRGFSDASYTMIGLKRLNNIQELYRAVRADDIQGDLLEAGVWRGGASIFMRALLACHQDQTRKVWVADSFQGFPPSENEWDQQIPWQQFKSLAVSLGTVKSNFSYFNLLDNQVKFLKGWFKDTLPTADISSLAILRLDGDLYASTMDVLHNLYAKVSKGGFIIVDDYYSVEGCQQAVTEFREMHNISTTLHTIDWTAVYWRKE